MIYNRKNIKHTPKKCGNIKYIAEFLIIANVPLSFLLFANMPLNLITYLDTLILVVFGVQTTCHVLFGMAHLGLPLLLLPLAPHDHAILVLSDLL